MRLTVYGVCPSLVPRVTFWILSSIESTSSFSFISGFLSGNDLLLSGRCPSAEAAHSKLVCLFTATPSQCSPLWPTPPPGSSHWLGPDPCDLPLLSQSRWTAGWSGSSSSGPPRSQGSAGPHPGAKDWTPHHRSPERRPQPPFKQKLTLLSDSIFHVYFLHLKLKGCVWALKNSAG